MNESNYNVKSKSKDRDLIRFNNKYKKTIKHNYGAWDIKIGANLSKRMKKRLVRIKMKGL